MRVTIDGVEYVPAEAQHGSEGFQIGDLVQVLNVIRSKYRISYRAKGAFGKVVAIRHDKDDSPEHCIRVNLPAFPAPRGCGWWFHPDDLKVISLGRGGSHAVTQIS